MRFVNDPVFGSVPPVGVLGVPVLVANRRACGEARLWDPVSGDAVALAEFLGGSFVAVDGGLFLRRSDGWLEPQGWVSDRVVVVRPPAGDPFTVVEHRFVSEFAAVDAGGDGDGVVEAVVPMSELVVARGEVAALEVRVAELEAALADAAQLPEPRSGPCAGVGEAWSGSAEGVEEHTEG